MAIPGATPRDLPSELALWLIGLAVEPIWNPPGQPTRNPKVERSNGLIQQWGRAAYLHRLPPGGASAGLGRPHPTRGVPGDPRSDPHGGLPATGHAAAGVSAGPRAGAVDLSRVDAFWAQGCWRRRADGNGAISIYGHGRAVGRTWARQELVVRFDAPSRCWLVSNQNGELVKQFPANERTRERIIALAVSRRR